MLPSPAFLPSHTDLTIANRIPDAAQRYQTRLPQGRRGKTGWLVSIEGRDSPPFVSRRQTRRATQEQPAAPAHQAQLFVDSDCQEPPTAIAAFPKHIIQVFRSFRQYGKAQNEPGYRARLTDWPEHLASSSGYLEGDTLCLNSSAADFSREMEQSSVIVLADYHPEQSHPLKTLRGPSQNECYAMLGRGERVLRYELFDLHRTEAAFELVFNYSDHASLIGRPTRGDFKVGELHVQQPVRVTVNGKSDATLTGRRARTYNFYDYIFLYLGICTDVRTLPWNGVRIRKPVPVAQARRVDLTKVLY